MLSAYNRNITIDFLVPYGGNGGVESVLNELALFLMKHDIHVRVIQLEQYTYRWVDPQIDYYPMSTNRSIHDISDYIPMCEQYITKLGAPDILIATPWPMLTMISRLAIINTNSHCKLVSWLHGPIETYEKNAYGGIESIEYADLVMVLSKKSYHYIRSSKPSINVRLIRNPIHIDNLPFHKKRNTECRNLIFMGRLSEEKRVNVILKAIATAHDRWNLAIYGDGNKLDELRQLTDSLNISNQVVFKGWIQQPWNDVHEAAALIISSEYEGFSLVCYEALACGIPVISTPVNGVTDIIHNGLNGYIYPHNSPEELAHILDNIGSGKYTPIDPYICHESVINYDANAVFYDTMNTLTSLLN